MYNIKQFQELNKPELFILTQHGRKRLIERDITINDIVETINNGKIIEDYPNDFPFPSCLIFAKLDNKIMHVCASIGDGYIYIITAYVPDTTMWESDFITRKN